MGVGLVNSYSAVISMSTVTSEVTPFKVYGATAAVPFHVRLLKMFWQDVRN
jgi:hypothetical protein